MRQRLRADIKGHSRERLNFATLPRLSWNQKKAQMPIVRLARIAVRGSARLVCSRPWTCGRDARPVSYQTSCIAEEFARTISPRPKPLRDGVGVARYGRRRIPP